MTAGTIGTVTLRVIGINREQDSEGRHPFTMVRMPIRLRERDIEIDDTSADHHLGYTEADGRVTFRVQPGRYHVLAGYERTPVDTVDVTAGCDLAHVVKLGTSIQLSVSTTSGQDDWQPPFADELLSHTGQIRLRIEWHDADEVLFPPDDRGSIRVTVLGRGIEVDQGPERVVRGRRSAEESEPHAREYRLVIPHGYEETDVMLTFGPLRGQLTAGMPPTLKLESYRQPTPIEGSISVGLRRTASRLTEDVPLWIGIRKSTDSLGFDRYFEFMNWVFCNDPWDRPHHSGRQRDELASLDDRRRLPFTDTDAYRNIKVATEAFVMANCGIFSEIDRFDSQYVIDQVIVPAGPSRLREAAERYLEPVEGATSPGVIPYLAIIRRKLADQRIKITDIGDVMLGVSREQVDACYGLLRRKLSCPCLLELIWSYWQEEGMLVQTMNALARRFQNVRSPRGNDPLANLEIDPLRPLNNVIWGYIQDEQHRLSVVRRNYEYDHHYGLRLAGRAVQEMRTADSRSKFLEAFHTLLSITANFYKRDDDTTIVADGFPVLNGLKEAHLILSQGAHNQFGDLPSTARIEMLMQQWILARPEFREFLPTRIMVAYPEPWMDRVDAMKKLQGWTDTIGAALPQPGDLRRAGPPVDPLRRLGERQRPGAGNQLGALLAAGDPGLPARLSLGVPGSISASTSTNARIDATLPSVHLVHRLEEQCVGRRRAVMIGRRVMLGLHLSALSRLGASERLARALACADARALRRRSRKRPRPLSSRGILRGSPARKRDCCFHRRCTCSAICSPAIAAQGRQPADRCQGLSDRPLGDRAGAASTAPHARPTRITMPARWRRRRGGRFRAGLRPIIVTDGLCPSCGRLAPLPELARAAADYGGHLVVDDTQALGIVGRPAGKSAPLGLGGGGTLAWYGLHGPRVHIGASLAKAFGAPLAVLVGGSAIVGKIAREGATRIHTSPPSMASIAAARSAVSTNATAGDLVRARLSRRIAHLRQGLVGIGARLISALPLPMQVVALPASRSARAVLTALAARKVRALIVEGCGGKPVLSVILTAQHANAEIDRLIEALAVALDGGSFTPQTGYPNHEQHSHIRNRAVRL